MLSFSTQYAAATTDAQRSLFEASGQAMLAIYQGTAFDVNYILGAVATLIISVVMLRSNSLGKLLLMQELWQRSLMLFPATAGTVGLYFALGSLVPSPYG